jgi:hypothetical protein
MSYPNAYCVKCGTHTETLSKHTVLLQNNARALRGVCQSCESEVYKILPKLKDAPKVKMTEEEKRRYPDAFCVKCQTHTPTANARTVILDNMSRAVTGSCKCCGSEVYRIIGASKGEPAPAAGAAKTALAKPESKPLRFPSDRRLALTRPAEIQKAPSHWTYLFAAGVIAGIVAGFMALTLI